MSKIDHIERASRAWPVLVKASKTRKYLTYKALGAAIGIHHRAVSHVLGVIQSYCIFENLPPLTIMVVNASAGLPGGGFIAHDLEEFDSGVESVCNFDWKSHENPFAFSGSSLSQVEIIKKLKSEPENSEEIYRKVKSRGLKQILFRKAVLEIYGHRCAFTGLSFVEALEACHIKPWSECSPAEKMDVRNGILLNRLHHKLFDDYYLSISEDHKIQFWDPKGEEQEYTKLEKNLTTKLHGQKINLPFRKDHRPGIQYIEYHNSIFNG